MTWKNLPAWLKGGIIGLILPIIVLIYELVKEPLYNLSDSIFGVIFATLLTILYPVILIIGFPMLLLEGPLGNIFFAFIISALIYFWAGAGIGRLVSKIKK
jgi:hypothetical protein